MTDEQKEIARLREMLAAAIQSLDAACAVRDITEKARRELLDALQRKNDEARHQSFIDGYLAGARDYCDGQSEMSMVNEQAETEWAFRQRKP